MESVNARPAAADRQHLQFEPAVVLPVQIQSPRLADASLVPEKLLLLAVLEEAITTFQRHVADTGRRGRRLFHEAETWLLSEEREWPCSFPNICDALGLDVGYLRDGLTRWRDERPGQRCSGRASGAERLAHQSGRTSDRPRPRRRPRAGAAAAAAQLRNRCRDTGCLHLRER